MAGPVSSYNLVLHTPVSPYGGEQENPYQQLAGTPHLASSGSLPDFPHPLQVFPSFLTAQQLTCINVQGPVSPHVNLRFL